MLSGLLSVTVPQRSPRQTRRVLSRWQNKERGGRRVAIHSTPSHAENIGRNVLSGVQIFDNPKKGEKRIVAEVRVSAPLEDVWQVLTAYEALPSFVPNLDRCEKLPSSKPGSIRLRQVGCSQSVLWRLEAEAEMEIDEKEKSGWRKEVHFRMVEGDFEEFYGRWIVESDVSSAADRATFLRYDIVIKPKFNLPSRIVSYIVKAGLPANIRAIADRAEMVAAAKLKTSGLASWVGIEENPEIPPMVDKNQEAPSVMVDQVDDMSSHQVQWCSDESLPTKGPFWPVGSPYAAAAPITAARQKQQAARAAAKSTYLGTAWVPLPPSGRPDTSIKEALNGQLKSKENLQGEYPSFDLSVDETMIGEPEGVNKDAAQMAEVHLRRLDDLEYLHRRAVATILVEAPLPLVWDVLSDYDKLSKFVPNLAASERIKLPPDAPPNVVRLRQIGYKNMFYMCIHAESVMDVVEKAQSEIQFRQIAGDLETFQGKWMLQEMPFYLDDSTSYAGPKTILKYAVELRMPTDSPMFCIIEPLLERVVFEDLGKNMVAIKREVERRKKETSRSKFERLGKTGKPRLAGMVLSLSLFARMRKSDAHAIHLEGLTYMIEDFGILRSELEALYGDTRTIPSRSELRACNRTDIEKALTAHGGTSAVMKRLGWKIQGRNRKPKGYWNSLENVKREIDEFILSSDLPSEVMPVKNDFVRAGRYDLARAIERWGGLYTLASELRYEVATPLPSMSSEWQQHISDIAATTGLSGKKGLFEVASSTYRRRAECSDDEILEGIVLNESLADAPRTHVSDGRRTRDPGKDSSFPKARKEIDSW